MRYMKIKNDVSKKILSNIQKRNNKVYTNEIDIAIATDTNFIRQTQIWISYIFPPPGSEWFPVFRFQ